MDKKFKYLYKHCLFNKIKKKSFIISNIILLIAVIIVTNITTIIGLFGGDFAEKTKIYVFDETNEVFELLEEKSTNFEYIKSEDVFQVDTNVYFDEFDAVLRITKSINMDTDENYAFRFYSKEDFSSSEILNINEDLEQIRPALYEKLGNDISAVLHYDSIIDTNFESTSTTYDDFLAMIGIIVLIPIFFLTLIGIQFLGSDIIEEKSSRSVEYVLSNVKAKDHLISKVLAIITFVVIQTVLTLIYALLGSVIGNSFVGSDGTGGALVNVLDNSTNGMVFNMLPKILIIEVLFIIFGMIFYLMFMAVLSSMATSMSDYQSFITPLMLVLLLGFYLAFFSLSFKGSLFIKILAYIPLFSPFLAPVLFASNQISLFSCLISGIILIIFDFIIFKYGIRLYKLYIIDYNQDKFFNKVKKIFKKQ